MEFIFRFFGSKAVSEELMSVKFSVTHCLKGHFDPVEYVRKVDHTRNLRKVHTINSQIYFRLLSE